MPVWRLQVSMAADTALPRDRVVMTPHFNAGGVVVDPQGLCDDLAAALHTWTAPQGTREIKVTAYDAQGTPPVFPQAEAIVNANLAPASEHPRELAVCLSFFGNANRPRMRGRLYVPVFLALGAASSTLLRPSAGLRQKVADLVPILTGLGGSDVDWSIYSRLDNVPRSVKNWFVDDEWDIVRSRGLRPTTRLTGTTTEA